MLLIGCNSALASSNPTHSIYSQDVHWFFSLFCIFFKGLQLVFYLARGSYISNILNGILLKLAHLLHNACCLRDIMFCLFLMYKMTISELDIFKITPKNMSGVPHWELLLYFENAGEYRLGCIMRHEALFLSELAYFYFFISESSC